jgi:hypothetical protein
MRVISGENDEEDGYVGRRRASWRGGSSPKDPDELGAPGGSTSMGLPK